jgi:hypothetical protein
MVRLSAIPFAVVIIVYSMLKARPAVRHIILAFCGMIVVLMSLFVIPNSRTVEWNLLGHHVGQWGELPNVERIRDIISWRIPSLMVFFSPYILVGISVVSIVAFKSMVRRRTRWYVRRHSPMVFVTLGLLLFTGASLGTGGFYFEYFVPVMASLFPILSIAFVKTCRCLEEENQETTSDRSTRVWSKAFLQIMFALCLVLVLVLHSVEVDLSGGELPVEEIRQVSRYVAQNTRVSDRIMALEALWIPVEANRAVLPGLTMAQFSYQEVTRQEARELKVINGELILEYIEHGAAKAIVFTDGDLKLFQESEVGNMIQEALVNRYELVLTREEFGQGTGKVYVYVRVD